MACHIAQRGVDRRETYSSDEDRSTYLRLLQEHLPDAKASLPGVVPHKRPRASHRRATTGGLAGRSVAACSRTLGAILQHALGTDGPRMAESALRLPIGAGHLDGIGVCGSESVGRKNGATGGVRIGA